MGGDSFKSAVETANLGKADRAALTAATQKAQRTMRAVVGFTGRQIASALVAGRDGTFDWDGASPAAKAIGDAIDAQAELSALLTDLANREDITGDAFEALSELALQCDRRRSEISALAMQLADDPAKGCEAPGLAAKLDAKLAAMLPRQAMSMHGNAEILDRLKAQLQPLADRLETFAARPNASVSSAEFAAYAVEVKTASAAIFRAASEGFPAPGGGRLAPDRDFASSLAALARFAENELEDVRRNIGNAALKDFADRVIGLPEDNPIFDPENVRDLYGPAPTVARLVNRRRQLHRACLEFIDNPSREAGAKVNALLARYAGTDTSDLDDELAYLEKHVKNVDGDEWKVVRSAFRSNPASMQTQVAHLLRMLKGVREAMTPEQFLSTDSARALLEGRLSFSTLVEARVHGMSDADVDPALDDSRLVSSKPLGSGAVNTVHLVAYADGAEYVFKPEAPGRQAMETLTLSKDYKPEQQVAQLNLATQSVANALGLGDAVPRCTVGAHKGEYGLFMAKAPGTDAVDFVKGKAAPGSLTAREVRDLEPGRYGQVLGGILRGLNRLEWLDLIAGQGDRHAHNYFIDVKPDLTVSVKGIDNDQSFPAYRTGLRTYVLAGKYADRFRASREEAILAYSARQRDAVRARMKADPGVTENPDGSITLDTGKFQAGELYYAAQAAIGMHGCTLPDYIDEDLYVRLTALKTGAERDALLADLAARLPPRSRRIHHRPPRPGHRPRRKLASEGKVVRAGDFAKRDVQNRILHRELHSPANPVRPVDGYKLPGANKIVKKATHQSHSLFVRDLYAHVAKKGWFT